VSMDEMWFNRVVLCPISNQSPAEESFNVLTHALGLLLSLIGLGVLVTIGIPQGLGSLAVALVYGLALTQLFAISTLYHFHGTSLTKMRYRIWDHCAIFILIAGSYTPFMTLSLGGWRGWGMLLLVWSLAAGGIRYKCRHPNPFGAVSVLFYLGMGWCVLLVLPQLIAALSTGALAWLVAGGVAYTLGVPFYAWQSLPYSHGVWHIFVLLGAACHYCAVVFYVL
jgi:hemolysin III